MTGLTIRAIRTTTVGVPMARPLGTSAGTVTTAPLSLIDLETEEGITGRGYLFCYQAAAGPAIAQIVTGIQEMIRGDAIVPHEIGARLHQRFRLIGVQGIVRMALAGIDIACWDAVSKAAGLPLASMLGARPRPLPAYNSNGLGLMPPAALVDEAEALLDGGFGAVKLRLGYATLSEDRAAVRAVRDRLPDHVQLMVDYNQALTLAEALRRGRMLDDEGVDWLEEPIRHDDYDGNAELAATLATPIQIGENFSGPQAMATALGAKAADLVMPDLERIGGVTGWMRAAGIAAGAGIEMSSHLFPEVSSHLLCATPTCHWLEWVDWASPILAEPLTVTDGMVTPSARPGVGLEWNVEAVRRYTLA